MPTLLSGTSFTWLHNYLPGDFNTLFEPYNQEQNVMEKHTSTQALYAILPYRFYLPFIYVTQYTPSYHIGFIYHSFRWLIIYLLLIP